MMTNTTMRSIASLWWLGCALAAVAPAQEICAVDSPAASFSIPRAASPQELSADPAASMWKRAASAWISRNCTRKIDYPDLKTEVRGFWTDTHLYLLFICPYRELNLWLPPQPGDDRDKLWDRDVVEFFLGDDWQNIRQYREFEIAPTGDWIDLAIDLGRDSYDASWDSGWRSAARIDEKARVWYAAAEVPLASVSSKPVTPGTRWRANLYRIDGKGPDAVRRFLCWQPTCVVNRDPNHVPEAFGTLEFVER